MVAPIVIWGGIALASAIAGGSAIGLTSKPDTQTSYNTTNNTSNITKKSSLIVEGGSSVGRVDFGGDDFTPNFRTEQSSDFAKPQTNLLSNPLVLAGLGVGGFLLYRRLK